MKITYFNDWNRAKIENWLRDRMDGKKQTMHNYNGYEIVFADGTKYEVRYGSFLGRTPTEIYINGALAQRDMN